MNIKAPALLLPDSRHLLAAQGWLELGNYLEANVELEEIAPKLRAHPSVLAIRWQIYAAAQCWNEAFEIASTLVTHLPDYADHWIQRSYALHELKRTREARDLLLPAATQFLDDEAIRYNLACYECQLCNLPEAKRWLTDSFARNNSKQFKLDALNDPDLEPLWQHIGEL